MTYNPIVLEIVSLRRNVLKALVGKQMVDQFFFSNKALYFCKCFTSESFQPRITTRGVFECSVNEALVIIDPYFFFSMLTLVELFLVVVTSLVPYVFSNMPQTLVVATSSLIGSFALDCDTHFNQLQAGNFDSISTQFNTQQFQQSPNAVQTSSAPPFEKALGTRLPKSLFSIHITIHCAENLNGKHAKLREAYKVLGSIENKNSHKMVKMEI